MDIIRRDLKDMDTSWDEAEELATDRAEWRQRVAQCIHEDAPLVELRSQISSEKSMDLPVLLCQTASEQRLFQVHLHAS